MRLEIARIEQVALGIKSFELADPLGRELPPFSAGGHLEVFLPNSRRRHYSLCGDTRDRSHYTIAVLWQENGAGGSKYMHGLRLGDAIEASPPRNNFPLVDGASEYLFVAGGIGITPILPMIALLQGRRARFELHYCVRSPSVAAFSDRLARLCREGQLHTHFDAGDPGKGLNVQALLRRPRRGAHVYCCGPAGLMDAVRRATAAWPEECVHFEHFSAPAPGNEAPARGFEIIVGSQDLKLHVPADRSIVDVLRAAGIHVETSCEAGVCGTCRTRYLSGQPIHNDSVLSERERREYVMLCCARASGAPLKLDL